MRDYLDEFMATYEALKNLYDSLVDTNDHKNPETGEEYQDCRAAHEIIKKFRNTFDANLDNPRL